MTSMQPNVNQIPNHPVPHVPPPQKPQRPKVQPTTVFVYEKPRWEYKVLTKTTTDSANRTEDELNSLGKEGWELVGVVSNGSGVQFYLKRTGA